MKFYKPIQLKDGTNCILRSLGETDAQDILQLMILTSKETRYMLRYPDEITMTEEEEANYLKDIELSPDALMLTAVVDGKITAIASFTPISRLQKCKHRAEIGISVLKEYWGRGIGTLLVENTIDLARQAGYQQLELEVVTDNKRAVSLYEKFGFRILGTNEKAFLCRDGQYQALHLMCCNL